MRSLDDRLAELAEGEREVAAGLDMRPEDTANGRYAATAEDARKRIAELEALLLAGLALHGGEAHTDSEKEWRAAARKALNLARL